MPIPGPDVKANRFFSVSFKIDRIFLGIDYRDDQEKTARRYCGKMAAMLYFLPKGICCQTKKKSRTDP